MARTNDVQFDRLIFEFLLRLHPDAETCSPKKTSRQFASKLAFVSRAAAACGHFEI